MSRDWQGKRYWLVGASEGLGRALAHTLSARGADLILSARRPAPLEGLAAELPGPAQVITCDIADSASVRAAAEQIGPLDGVICLAGVYWPQAAQDWNPDQVEAMCDINFTGTARVAGAVIGPMVERGAGHIVLTGSLSGFGGLPGAIGYAASKAGVMALAESMACDLRGTGVEVQLINPGFIRTRLTDKNDFAMPFIQDPTEAARHMLRGMERGGFSHSYPRPFSWVFRGARLLPNWLYFRLFGT